ncbi:MAG: SUMF1/EgtB/PvdO family nonheme iron enzyme [Deltaproteobacteria bacterium]|nr:SUMF1/EgtB/PvdO family nonheme iron enzyme [Deltaproteobacteria bacterium]
MSVLLGAQATAGLNVALLGLNWAGVPAGTYEIGASDQPVNPIRQVATTGFELAKTTTTNAQLAAALRQFEGKNTVLMAESVRDRRFAILARGTRAEIGKISDQTLTELLVTMNLPRNISNGKVEDRAVKGALKTFDLGSNPVTIVPVTLESHLPAGFDRPNQPALVSPFEASAFAAVFGLELPTGEEWEIAAGDLRDPKYLNEEELRRVAHLQPANTTADVGTKDPNSLGIYDMLGNVWAVMANLLPGSVYRELRGGSWVNDPDCVRAVFRLNDHPADWYVNVGFRLVRPQHSLNGVMIFQARIPIFKEIGSVPEGSPDWSPWFCPLKRRTEERFAPPVARNPEKKGERYRRGFYLEEQCPFNRENS